MIPDQYNSQDWDRYAFVRNNPVRYTDPSGHETCDEEGNCYNPQRGWYSLGITPRWNTGTLRRAGYSSWEAEALSTLYSNSGAQGRHAVVFMVNHNSHLRFSEQSTGAGWHHGSNDIFLASGWENQNPTNATLLSLIAHEAKHLEQPLAYRLTVAGEVEGWQVHFAVYRSLTGRYPRGDDPNVAPAMMELDASALSPIDALNAKILMGKYDHSYIDNAAALVYIPSAGYFRTTADALWTTAEDLLATYWPWSPEPGPVYNFP